MNKTALIINGILGIAVIVLFWLHFSSKSNNNSVGIDENNNSQTLNKVNDSLDQYFTLDSNITAKPIKIAFVNSDSLDKNLKVLKDVEIEITAKETELGTKIKSEQAKYQNSFKTKVANFEKRSKSYTLKAPSMTDAQLQKEQEELQAMQQELAGLEQKYQLELMEFQGKLEQEYLLLKSQKMSDYYKKVQGFCEGIAKRLGFDFILIYQEGGAILHANKMFDISNYVIDAINKEYDSKKGL